MQSNGQAMDHRWPDHHAQLEAYVEHGLLVFPCHSVENGLCTCGRSDCNSVAKHPCTKHGLKDASRASDDISRWWPERSSRPRNVAVATGETSGVLVVDIDPRHGGDATLAVLEEELGPLPRDWVVATGGGGRHFYFLYPQGESLKSRNSWRTGVDIKSDGGYVIAPPSLHQSGKRYEWARRSGTKPPPLPESWRHALQETERGPRAERNSARSEDSLLLQRAHQYAASVPGATEGGRNEAAFSLAGNLAAFVTESGTRLSEAQVLETARGWNVRCAPPLDDKELKTCVASAMGNGTPRPDKVVADVSQASQAEADDDRKDESDQRSKSQATLLVELAAEADLFQDLEGEAYARFPVHVGDRVHFEVARVRGRRFKRWLLGRFYREQEKAPGAQSQQDALGVIEAKALFEGDHREVFVRLGQHGGGIYLDLCSPRWQVVEIDRQGWRLLDKSPVMFRRSKSMMPLPTPVRDGSIQELRRFVNLTDEDWPLVLAWLVAALRPKGPYPVLAVHAEHGSGKSWLCRLLRSLVDPNTAPLRADYREPRDLMVCADNGWVIALDNLSRIPHWLSDCFCRLATGGGFSCRQLYTDDEEMIFSAQRPLMLNCIEEIISRSDLMDRCLMLNLPRIEPGQRRTEKQLTAEFEEACPRLLGGLLDAVVAALRNEEGVVLDEPPRMADFAVWATAAEPGLGLEPGSFLTTYQKNREAGNQAAIESSPVGRAILGFVGKIGNWSGTATELLQELDSRADEKTRKLKAWPQTAPALGNALKRLAPNLRESGAGVEFSRTNKIRTITLTRKPEQNTVTPVTPVTAAENTPDRDDRPVTGTGVGDRNGFDGVTQEAALSADRGPSDSGDGGDGELAPVSSRVEWVEV